MFSVNILRNAFTKCADLSNYLRYKFALPLLNSMGPHNDRERYELSLNRRQFSSSNIPLPKLPVPALNDTLSKLKEAAEPFANDTKEYENLCSVIDEFGSNNGIGQKLHKLLELKATKTTNWLSRDWWLRKAYLEGRDSIMIWSNPGLVFPKLPKPDNPNKALTTEFISRLVLSVIDFRNLLKKGVNPEAPSNDPNKVPDICMDQYSKVFGTCRIPGNPSDSIIFGNINTPKDEISIIISRMNKFYKLNIKKCENYDEILPQIKLTIAKILSDDSPQSVPIGSLTSLPRNDWTIAYSLLNQNALKDIIDAEFVVCIDHIEKHDENRFNDNYLSSMGKQILHSDITNIGNRWFDKTVQLIVVTNSDGSDIIGAGLCYEHTPAEAGPIVKILEHTVKHISSFNPKVSQTFETPKVYELNLIPNENRERISAAGNFAIEKYQKFADSLVMDILEFKDYGKDYIKSLKYSPDSWIQIAISLAYYRVHGKFGGCYETGSTRKFAFGRTDTIRSLTGVVAEFIKSPDFTKLQQAIDSHKMVVKDVTNGNGIDRVLLGLNCTAQEVKSDKWEWGIPEDTHLPPKSYELIDKLYKDELFLRSKHFNLSTSQIPILYPNSFTCYGPSVTNGYGCCYNPTKNQITFAISAFNENNEGTNVIKYKEELSKSLLMMREIASKRSKL